MNNINELSQREKSNSKRPVPIQMSGLFFNDEGTFIPKRLGDEIIKRNPLFYDGNHLFLYENGVYKRDDGGKIGKIIVDLLGEKFRRNRYSETVFYIQNKSWIDIDTINKDMKIINLKNGLYDWTTGELNKHTPKFFSTIQIPVWYNPGANPSNIEKFISEIVPTDTAHLLYEWFGYSLIPSTRHEKSVILNGSGANGKSKLIELYERFIGSVNISNIALQELEENRFKLAQLYGKLANVYADLPASTLEKTNIFKTTASGDRVNAEFKGRDSFDFKPFARLMFSTNELPRTTDLSDGFFRRLLIIEFPNKFGVGGLPKDPNIMDKLTTENELSGLFNKAIEGLRRLENKGGFSTNASTENAVVEYKKYADPVQYFIEEMCIVEDDKSCDKQRLYDYYSSWCLDSGFKPLGKYKFYNRISTSLKITEYRPSSDSKRRYRGVGLCDS